MKIKGSIPNITEFNLILLLAVIWAWLPLGCSSPPEPDGVDIIQALSREGDFSCYAQADRPRAITFPEDLGAHEDFKTEWWYYTGNLTSDTGRHFGFQLTFFRRSLACKEVPGDSGWRTRQLYFAHFALTDIRNQTFYSAQRINRGAVGIAGAQSHPYKVWIDDWTVQKVPGSQALILKAKDRTGANGRQTSENISINLELTPTKPAVLQGQNGWSKKGSGPRDGSYYYSFPGMAAQGRLSLGQETHRVQGKAWFDHEWSTSPLGDRVGGWDWFAFHLSQGPLKGADIMVCQIRSPDGTPNGFGFGSISFADGSHAILSQNQFTINPLGHWTSPRTHRQYPSKWSISLPGHDLVLGVSTLAADQEHPHGFPYYEGAITIKGQHTTGMGYVEMTGY